MEGGLEAKCCLLDIYPHHFDYKTPYWLVPALGQESDFTEVVKHDTTTAMWLQGTASCLVHKKLTYVARGAPNKFREIRDTFMKFLESDEAEMNERHWMILWQHLAGLLPWPVVILFSFGDARLQVAILRLPLVPSLLGRWPPHGLHEPVAAAASFWWWWRAGWRRLCCRKCAQIPYLQTVTVP